MLKPFKTAPAPRPDLMGPYTTGEVGEAFRARFGTRFVKSPGHPDCWLLGDDKVTLSYNRKHQYYAVVEKSLEEVLRILNLPNEQKVGDNAFDWEDLGSADPKFKYLFLDIEERLQSCGYW